MGIFDFIRAGINEMTIARPQGSTSVVHLRQEQEIPVYSQVVVGGDECAVLLRSGAFAGALGPGQHTLHENRVPFVASLRTPRPELLYGAVAFVITVPIEGVLLTGQIQPAEPSTGLPVPLTAQAEVTLRIIDPVRFVLASLGQGAVGDRLIPWLNPFFFMSLQTHCTEILRSEGRSVSDLPSLQPLLIHRLLQHAPHMLEIGVQVQQIPNLVIGPHRGATSPRASSAGLPPSQAGGASQGLESIGSNWSRPRGVMRLFPQVGLQVPTRLTTKRFTELMASLEAMGIEAQLIDGTPVSSSSQSPGADASIRLRRVPG